MSIEDTLRQQGASLRQEKDAWDLDSFVARLGRRVAAEDVHGKAPDRPQRAAGHTRPEPGRPSGRTDRPRALPAALCALSDAEELVRLCEDAVTVPEVKPLLERFLADFEPSGARVFACLLYLADQAEHALFWWRFASGGEDGLAAYCLTLHSRAAGTRRQTQAWSAYTRNLCFDPEQHWPQPHSRNNQAFDTRRVAQCVRTHLRTEPVQDAILLPTADLPGELVEL